MQHFCWPDQCVQWTVLRFTTAVVHSDVATTSAVDTLAALWSNARNASPTLSTSTDTDGETGVSLGEVDRAPEPRSRMRRMGCVKTRTRTTICRRGSGRDNGADANSGVSPVKQCPFEVHTMHLVMNPFTEIPWCVSKHPSLSDEIIQKSQGLPLNIAITSTDQPVGMRILSILRPSTHACEFTK